MTLGSVLYGLTIVLCLGLAALLAEQLLRSGHRPTRWPWVGATLLSVVLPWMPAASGFFQHVPVVQAVDQFTGAVSVPVVQPFVDAVQGVPPATPAAPLANLVILPASMRWLPSAVLLLFFAVAWLRLMLWRRNWRRASLLGADVLVSDNTGPAVIGFLRSGIVVPTWALALPIEQQRLLLQHEQEHLRTHDARLLLLAGAALVLSPWNVVLWWMVQRLRLAIEVDCDRRVLASGADTREYGSTLVNAAERNITARFIPAVGMALSAFSLERRLRSILRPAQTLRPVRLITGLGAVIALVLIACSATPPMQTTKGRVAPAAVSRNGEKPREPGWMPDSTYLFQTILNAYGEKVPERAGQPALFCFIFDEYGQVVRQDIGWEGVTGEPMIGFTGADTVRPAYSIGHALKQKFPELYAPDTRRIGSEGGRTFTLGGQKVLVFWGRFAARAYSVTATPDPTVVEESEILLQRAAHDVYGDSMPSSAGKPAMLWLVLNADWTVRRHGEGHKGLVEVPADDWSRFHFKGKGPVYSVNESLKNRFSELTLRDSRVVSNFGGGQVVLGGDTASVYWARYAQ